VRFFQKYRRFLALASAFSHLKIVVSFMTVMITLDTQFGVSRIQAHNLIFRSLPILATVLSLFARGTRWCGLPRLRAHSTLCRCFRWISKRYWADSVLLTSASFRCDYS
jgi:hypothetical protein